MAIHTFWAQSAGAVAFISLTLSPIGTTTSLVTRGSGDFSERQGLRPAALWSAMVLDSPGLPP